ncbi:hypothetical protein FRC17_004138 [Serendipita sp. 399]|nr:hypothetical protein FRC17_004138 [Serendipita sp. 399]
MSWYPSWDGTNAGLESPRSRPIPLRGERRKGGRSFNQITPDPRTVWSCYDEKSKYFNSDLINDVNNTVDVLLIFAGLFSAILSAFISQTYAMLKPDPVDTLTLILQELKKPGSVPDQPFIVPNYVFRVNCFLFSGLAISIMVASLVILIKQWMRSYQRDLAAVSSPHLRARTRHFRYQGIKRWHLAEIIGLLSISMHIALLISAVGIVDLLLSTVPTVGYVALSLFIPGTLFFLFTALLPLFVVDAPFHSPMFNFLVSLKRAIHVPNLRRGRRANNMETLDQGLEDLVGKVQRREKTKNSAVYTQLHLDLDIICHLLEVSDKTTERQVLDLCFDKLPQLALLEKRSPDLFLQRDIILDVYVFLAKGCVMYEHGEGRIHPNRFERSRKLCNFISWFLSLPRSTVASSRLQQRLREGFDPMELPSILTNHHLNANFILAYTARGRLKHLLGQDQDNRKCPVCEQATLEVQIARYHPNLQFKLVTSFIVTHSDCLLFYEKVGDGGPGHSRLSMCDHALDTLKNTLAELPIPDKGDQEAWLYLIEQWKEECSPNLRTMWFNKLRIILGGSVTHGDRDTLQVPIYPATSNGGILEAPLQGSSLLLQNPPDEIQSPPSILGLDIPLEGLPDRQHDVGSIQHIRDRGQYRVEFDDDDRR